MANVRPYDLTTPEPINNTVMEKVDAQIGSLCHALRLSLRKQIRLTTNVAIDSLEIDRGRNLSRFSDQRAWWYCGGDKAAPVLQDVFVGVAPTLVYVAIDRILGGPGDSKLPQRLPSNLELELGHGFLRGLTLALQGALAKQPLNLEFAPGQPVDQPLNTFLVDLDKIFARLEFAIEIGEERHSLALCLSRQFLASAASAEKPAGKASGGIGPGLKQTPNRVVAELARCRLTVEEASKLDKGDVVVFDLEPGGLLDLTLDDQVKFRGTLGVHKGFYAIEVTERAQSEGPIPNQSSKPAAASGDVGPRTKKNEERGSGKAASKQQPTPKVATHA